MAQKRGLGRRHRRPRAIAREVAGEKVERPAPSKRDAGRGELDWDRHYSLHVTVTSDGLTVSDPEKLSVTRR
jgi:hypothetical protein